MWRDVLKYSQGKYDLFPSIIKGFNTSLIKFKGIKGICDIIKNKEYGTVKNADFPLMKQKLLEIGIDKASILL